VTAEGSKLGTDLRIGEAGILDAKIAIEEKLSRAFSLPGGRTSLAST